MGKMRCRKSIPESLLTSRYFGWMLRGDGEGTKVGNQFSMKQHGTPKRERTSNMPRDILYASSFCDTLSTPLSWAINWVRHSTVLFAAWTRLCKTWSPSHLLAFHRLEGLVSSKLAGSWGSSRRKFASCWAISDTLPDTSPAFSISWVSSDIMAGRRVVWNFSTCSTNFSSKSFLLGIESSLHCARSRLVRSFDLWSYRTWSI